MSTRSSQPLSTIVCLLLAGVAAFALADLSARDGRLSRWLDEYLAIQGSVATVHGEPVTKVRLQEALRHHLFRHGLDWSQLSPQQMQDIRTTVLGRVVDNALIRHARRAENPAPSAGDVTRSEFHDFVSEFDPREEYTRRLALQSVTEGQLLGEMAELNADYGWIVAQLQVPAVSSADVGQFLTSNPGPAKVPEVWRARHLFLSGHEVGKGDRTAEIQALREQIAAGTATLSQLILKHSEDERTKTKDGDLGWFAEARMPADFISAVKGLGIKQVSQPFKGQLGWHIVEVTDHHAARPASAGETSPEVAARLEHERRSAALDVFMNRLRSANAAHVIIDNTLLNTVVPAGYDRLHPAQFKLPSS